MVHEFHDEAAAVPTPSYLPFAAPSDVINLYCGPLQLRVNGELTDALPGTIELIIRSGSQLLWKVDIADAPLVVRRQWRYRDGHPDVRLVIPFRGLVQELDVYQNGDASGFFGRAATGGAEQASSTQVITHWVNLANLPFGGLLCLESDSGWTEWGGRSTFDLAGWEITIDACPDLASILAETARTRL